MNDNGHRSDDLHLGNTPPDDVTSGGNVVTFPKKDEDEIVLVCSECKCMSFILHENGSVECSSCDTYSDAGAGVEWRKQYKPLTDADKDNLKDTKALVVKQLFGYKELARARALKFASDAAKTDSLALILAYDEDGAGQHWTVIETQDQKDWTIDKIETMLEYIQKLEINEQEGAGETKEEVAPPSGSGVE